MPRPKAVYPNRRNPGRPIDGNSRTDSVGRHLDNMADTESRGVSPEDSSRLVEIARLMRKFKIDADEAERMLDQG